MSNLSVRGVQAVAAKALARGGQVKTPISTEWDVSGRCERPVHREIGARPFRGHKVVSTFSSDDGWGVLTGPSNCDYGPQNSYFVDLVVKCRNCPQCLRERAWGWRVRMKQELHASYRTWLCTFTLSPEAHERMANQARMICSRRRREDFELMTLPEQFIARHNQIQKEFTLMFKRMRKAGLKFRYILVCEMHKSGLPHYHMLLHEFSDNIKYAKLKEFWRLGFSNFKLVDDHEKAAMYAAKYLTKSKLARVRASLRYGSPLAVPIAKREKLDLQKPQVAGGVGRDSPT